MTTDPKYKVDPMGVVPLVLSHGAGAEMRQAIGISVFSGMLGVTFFGLILTPVFYVLVRRLDRPAVQALDKVELDDIESTTSHAQS